MRLDATQSAIVVNARHPGLTRVLMGADEADDVCIIGDIKDGAGWMIR